MQVQTVNPVLGKRSIHCFPVQTVKSTLQQQENLLPFTDPGSFNFSPISFDRLGNSRENWTAKEFLMIQRKRNWNIVIWSSIQLSDIYRSPVTCAAPMEFIIYRRIDIYTSDFNVRKIFVSLVINWSLGLCLWLLITKKIAFTLTLKK